MKNQVCWGREPSLEPLVNHLYYETEIYAEVLGGMT